ncbi:MAG: hypothetical protein MN733_10695 [Nitrososphaera sp.]|nr:hypothetical protein [Nitrososphaera sp.]
MTERERFTQEEAQAKVGKRIKSLVEFSGVPKGTTGEVIQADPSSAERGPTQTFTVAIQWDLPRSKPIADLVIPADAEPYIFIRTDKPLVDWFTKDEYERYLEELKDDTN